MMTDAQPCPHTARLTATLPSGATTATAGTGTADVKATAPRSAATVGCKGRVIPVYADVSEGAGASSGWG